MEVSNSPLPNSTHNAPRATSPSTLLESISNAWLKYLIAALFSPDLKCCTPVATLCKNNSRVNILKFKKVTFLSFHFSLTCPSTTCNAGLCEGCRSNFARRSQPCGGLDKRASRSGSGTLKWNTSALHKTGKAHDIPFQNLSLPCVIPSNYGQRNGRRS